VAIVAMLAGVYAPPTRSSTTSNPFGAHSCVTGASSLGIADRGTTLEAEGSRSLDLVRRARRTVGNRADRPRDLYRREPDTTANGMDEHALVPTQMGLRDQRIVRGDERLGNRARVFPRHARRNTGRCPGGHGQELRMRPATRDAEHAIPD
jgi:hypothetical protein